MAKIILMNVETIKFLNKLKSYSSVNKEVVICNSNKLIFKVVPLLYKEGMILSYSSLYNSNNFKIYLRYSHNKPVLKNLKIISTPSRIFFLSSKDISRLNLGKNIFIFSTSQGTITGIDCKKRNIGGVLLFIC